MKETYSHQSYRKASSPRGFTLIELLVTMAIIATLAGITSMWAISKNREAKVAAKTMQYKQLFLANESYASEQGSICPAQIDNNLWTYHLSPYLSGQRNADVIIKDELWPDYDPDTPYLSGIGMAFKHKLPESNDRNWFNDGDDVKRMSFEEITYKSTRILMGDSTNWFLNDVKVDATRHEDPSDPDSSRGMFLLFDGAVRFYTEAEAKLGLTNPASLQN